MKTGEYIAHISEDGNRVQTVQEHLRGTAELCRLFAETFHSGPFGELIGLAHDIGKFSDGFQKRLYGGPKVDHSSAGAVECAAMGLEIAGLCVAGHHGGLPDFGNKTDMAGDETFVGRIKRVLPDRKKLAPGWHGTLPSIRDLPDFKEQSFAKSLWIRMLYSCLVDADFLDTERFMKNGEVDRGKYDDIDMLWVRLTEYTRKWRNAETELNRIRNGIRSDCIAAGESGRGLFSLTVPTGGGKTVSSLAFALAHAKKHGLRRVIYVIPYTSIIEQNAGVFREILGENNVVEHHSEAVSSYDENLSEVQKCAALAAENWDAPVIVTTAVQFFESLYANKPSKCRKLHNIVDSVVIFDEAQCMPIGHLLPCMAVIGTLVSHFGVSAVLCSATQPFVTDLLDLYAPNIPIREICSDVDSVFRKLERVQYKRLGMLSSSSLVDILCAYDQVLCIVNARKTAKELYELLPSEGSFHLSTLMTPMDRKRTLTEIRNRLSAGLCCRVVSTSLIEAGVDIDFPYVYREMTGLDSIVQAGGRCNREGRRKANDSIVFIFETESPQLKMLRLNVGAATEAMAGCKNIGAKETVDRYFRVYRSFVGKENIDKTESVKYLSNGKTGCQLPYRTVAENFRFIDQNTKTVYIPSEENRKLFDNIRNGTASRTDYRKAGCFSVNIYEDHYRELCSTGCIEEIDEASGVLIDEKQYNDKTGLSLSVRSGEAIFM